MTFTDWFFSWPILVVLILLVAAARIWLDHPRDNHQDDDDT